MDTAFLKNCAEELKFPLFSLFRKSLDTSTIPEEWRQADISPIHKKGPNNIMNNYRPVNLTSQVSKAFESIFSERLMTHLYSNLLISQEQHGFVKGRNCQTNILSCLEDWTRAVDKMMRSMLSILIMKKLSTRSPTPCYWKSLNGMG